MILIQEVPNIPEIKQGDDIGQMIIERINHSLKDGDILCVASKIISKAEGRIQSLIGINPSDLAL